MTAEDTANAVIDDARNFASDSFNNAQDLISQAVLASQGFVTTELESIGEGREFPVLELPNSPEGFGGSPDLSGSLPSSPSLQSVPSASTPDFSGISKPSPMNLSDLFDHDQPVFNIPEFNRDVPEVSDPTIPEAPDIEYPDAPDLKELSFPDEPSTSVPGFDPDKPGDVPTDVPDAEDKLRVSFDTILPQLRDRLEQDVDSFIDRHSPNHKQIMSDLEQRLSDMQEGGTAMPAEVEQRIHDRARARTEAERANTEAEAAETAARRGHTLPPGAMSAMMERAAIAAAQQNAQTSSDIAVEQARLEQQNIQFALQTAWSMRQAIINSALQYASTLASLNEQAMQYAQAVARSALDVYNARVQIFDAQVRYYQAQAQVYETELRAAFAELERYQTLIRVEELKSNVNSQLVQQYQQQADVQRTRIQTYAEQLRAASLQLEGDRTRIQAFGEAVSAYSTQVQAKQAEYQVYEAAMRGDEAKVRGYATQVEAYRAEIGAETAKSQAEVEHSQAVASINRSMADVFRSEIQAYGVDVDAKKSAFEAEVRAYETGLQAYQADVQAQIESVRAEAENARLEADKQIKQYQANADVAMKDAQLFMERIKNVSDAAISGASVYGNIASAAVSAQNTMVSLANETLQTGSSS